MNLLKIKQAILALDNSELRELNSYVVDRSKQLGREKKTEFYIGQRIRCQGDIFTISKINRTRAKCIKDVTGERYNIPFSLMSIA
jgi:hypothetical protein